MRYADWAASPTYIVPLDGWSRDTLNIGLGGEWKLSDRLAFGARYRGGFGTAGQSHGAEIAVSLSW